MLKQFIKNTEFNKTLKNCVTLVLALVAALLLGAIVIAAINQNPLQAYKEMFSKSFFDPYNFLQTLVRSAPIIISAAAAAVAWRAGYINLGMQGQMAVGGLLSTVVGLWLPESGPWATVLTFAVGMLGGALFAIIPTYFDYKFGASLIITTLMLNYAADNITNYFAAFPLKDPAGDGLALQTPQIAEQLRLYRFSQQNTFNVGFFIAVAVIVIIYIVFKRTRFGYESKMTGLNPHFAKYGGISCAKLMFWTMALSGAISGLAACVEIYGVRYRFISSMFSSTSYAWTGLMAALVAQFQPWLILIFSIFLSGLNIGGQALQRSAGIPMQLADIIQCCITLFVSIRVAVDWSRIFKFGKRTQTVGDGK